MKMINIITEEMIMKIIPLTNKEELSFSVDENSITYEAGEDDDSYVIDDYDLARFLCVDAWGYFNKKGWYIEMYTRIIRVSIDDIHWHTVVITDYPSKLHAMADIIKYMWEQKEKNDGK